MKHPDIHLQATALGQPSATIEPRSVAAVNTTSDLHSLYDSHFTFVWRNLRRLGVSEERAEDATQEVFLAAHRRWQSFDPARSSAQTWLFGFVVHTANNERRAGRRRNARVSSSIEPEFWESVPSAAAGPAELLDNREAARLLEQTLESLTEQGRAVFVMVDIESMSVPEAAEALGVNLNTAYGRLRNARADFQQALKRLRAQREEGELSMLPQDLTELDADAKSVIAATRGMYDPAPGVEARLRRKLELSLAAGGAVAWYATAAAAASVKVAAVVVSLGLAGTGVWYVQHRAPASVHVARLTPSASAAAASVEPVAAPSLLAPEPSAKPASVHRLALAAGSSSASRSSDLAAETLTLTQVNAALNRHDGASALALLNDYDRHSKSRLLFAERSAARVLALCVLGRASEAAQEAGRFAERFPSSPLNARVRASCAGPASPAKSNAP